MSYEPDSEDLAVLGYDRHQIQGLIRGDSGGSCRLRRIPAECAFAL